MRSRLIALLLLSLPSLLCATLPGDAMTAVLKERGQPINKMEFGKTKVLVYPDAEIRLENEIVVTVTPRTADPTRNQPPPPPKPRAR